VEAGEAGGEAARGLGGGGGEAGGGRNGGHQLHPLRPTGLRGQVRLVLSTRFNCISEATS
jgi:hypothetical protein